MTAPRESPPGDISFPDLSFYGTGEVRTEGYVLPGARTPVHDHTPHHVHYLAGRPGKSTTHHPLPSIASQLFPQAQPKEGGSTGTATITTFGFAETPRGGEGLSSSSSHPYEPGMGKPPVAKRPRSRAGELKADDGARNATGRNVSGAGGEHVGGEPDGMYCRAEASVQC
jgi:hypothetical protein